MDCSPVIIIGAPRSGTNMLRDVLTRFEGVGTWPCDEINMIWRYGNVHCPSDELPLAMAQPRVRAYIRRQFGWVARRYNVDTVVEKTCANSLRIPFVDAVVPEARYVFIRRDGLDAVASAMACWTAGMDLPYVARKGRFVPPSDLAGYCARYAWNRAHRFLTRERRVASWGPRLDGMDLLLAKHPLDEVCAHQWRRCVDEAAEALQAMPERRWLEVGYEDFVREPRTELDRVLNFLGLKASAEQQRAAIAGVSASSIGKGRSALSKEAMARIQALIEPTLVRYGYA